MGKDTAISVHWSFWLICAIALLWNVGGAINYFMQTNLELVASLPETHRAIIDGRPAWATGGFAIGVYGGVLGCILLLLKKSTALYVFVASLIGVIVTMVHTINIANSKIYFSTVEIFVMIVLPIIVSIILVWYTIIVMKKGWVS